MNRVARRRLLAALLWMLTLGAPALAEPPAGGWRPEGPFGGRVVDVAFDPHAAGVAWAASSNGGVFRSADGGQSWAFAGRPKTGNQVEWLEVDPGTAGTLWLGVEDPGDPALWRSRDGGATWKLVTDSYKGQLASLHPVGYRIAFAPSKPSDVWVPSTNLHFRSRDGGKTWSDFRVLAQDAYAIAVDPKNPDVVYAGGHGGEAAHLARSDDGGKSWQAVGQGLEPAIQQLLVDPANPATVFAVTRAGGFFKSTDRGATFAAAASPVEGSDDIYSVRFAPGGALWAATEDGLKRSDDGGRSWRKSDRASGRYLVLAVAFDPRDAQAMLAASAGGGVYRSADGGASWSFSGEGISAGWVERLDASPRAATLFAQLSTGLFRRDGDGPWVELADPFEKGGKAVDVDGVLFERQSPKGVWAFEASSAWRSADGGHFFKALPQKEPSMRELLKGVPPAAQFRSLAQDPGNPKIFYAGSWSPDEPVQAVFKTVDDGKSWKPAGNGLPKEAVTALASEAPGVVLAIVGKALFRTDDGGGSWAQQGSGLPATELRELVIDPTTPSRCFLATEQGLFRSTDDGASFVKLASALAKEDVEAVAVAPDGRVYAGSFRGVFASRDAGTTWAEVNEGLTHLDVRALAVGGPPEALRLWAGSAGGGVFSRELP